jgi:hypothetical protein
MRFTRGDVRDHIASSKIGHGPPQRAVLEVAKKLHQYRSFVHGEGGERKIVVVELLFAEAIGFDPREAIKRLRSNPIRPHQLNIPQPA